MAAEFKHWQLTKDAEAILWLTLDRADSRVNSINVEIIQELNETIQNEILLENANLIFNQIIEKKINLKKHFKSVNCGIIYNSQNAILFEISNSIKIGDFECNFSQYSGNVFINSHIFGISAINDTYLDLEHLNGRKKIIQFIKGIEALNK